MRILLTFLILLGTAYLHASEPQTPRGIVFSYECEQANKAQLGFSCLFDRGSLIFQLHKQEDDMSPEAWKRSLYEREKLAIRFFELGGPDFEVIADWWEPNKVMLCDHGKHRPGYTYSCEYRVKGS